MMDKKYDNTGKIEDRVIEECSEIIKTFIKNKRSKLNYYLNRSNSNNEFKILNEINEIKDLLKNHKQDFYESEIDDLKIVLKEYEEHLFQIKEI